jgi:hypothetical protein
VFGGGCLCGVWFVSARNELQSQVSKGEFVRSASGRRMPLRT